MPCAGGMPLGDSLAKRAGIPNRRKCGRVERGGFIERLVVLHCMQLYDKEANLQHENFLSASIWRTNMDGARETRVQSRIGKSRAWASVGDYACGSPRQVALRS